MLTWAWYVNLVISMGPKNAYKDMLDNVVSLIHHVVMNHQNHTRTNGIWGHVRYNLPRFGDLWQHKQSKYKFAKIDKIRTTHIFLDAYHHPTPPRSNPPLYWSSLSMFTHSLPPPSLETTSLLWSHILPLWNKISKKVQNKRSPRKLANPSKHSSKRNVIHKGESCMNHDP
jgi:hypothetical protein